MTNPTNTLPYHDTELQQAIDAPDDGWNRPILADTDRAILDIGCGIGQTFVAWGRNDRLLAGLDVDEAAIREGMERAPWAQLLLQGGERIPYPAGTFDLVMSRVSLVYCDIPATLREVHRTLKPGGHIWFTMHTRRHSENSNTDYSRARKASVWVNSWLLRVFGFTVPIRGRHETWQYPEAFIALLDKHGFTAQVDFSEDPKGNDVFRVTGVRR